MKLPATNPRYSFIMNFARAASRFSPMCHKAFRRLATILCLVPALILSAPGTLRADENGRSFPTPAAAVAAPSAAVDSQDTNALGEIFGPKMAEIRNPDRVQ